MTAVIDADIERAIDELKADRDRLQADLEFIARCEDHKTQGFRRAFYGLRWYARRAVQGELSPGIRATVRRG